MDQLPVLWLHNKLFQYDKCGCAGDKGFEFLSILVDSIWSTRDCFDSIGQQRLPNQRPTTQA